MISSFYSTAVKRLYPRPLLSRSPQRVLWRGTSNSKTPPENSGDRSLNQQILEALKKQNQLLTSIDARLGRIEQQPSSMARRQRPTAQMNAGSWRFAEGDGAKAAKPLYGSIDEEGTVLVGSVGKKHTVVPFNKNFFIPRPTSILSPSDEIIRNSEDSIRDLLPKLHFNEKAELGQRSGIYVLTIKYNKTGEHGSQFPGR